MARWYGSTTERALGADHVADLKRLKAALREGEPCWRCGEPMYSWQKLERDHVLDRSLGGAQGPAVLAHASCNRSAGATLGNQLRGFTPVVVAGKNVTCRTCGKPYHYAARTCEVCQLHYHPSYGEQRTCSRSCGVELRRRNHGSAGRLPKARPACRVCGKPCNSLQYACCSTTCAAIARSDGKPGQFTNVAYYTCRYCGKTSAVKATGQPREVCPARQCQLARIQANNLRVRNGLTQAEADEQMAALIRDGNPPPHERWRTSSRW